MNTSHITWEAGRDWHRYQVQQFTCAEPDVWLWSSERGKHHPRPWEIEVQSAIRDLRPKLPPGESLLLGRTITGQVAAVSYFGYDNTGEQFFIWAVARDTAYRGRHLGRQALQFTMRALRATKRAEGRDCGVFARIHPKNEASRRLFAEAGFEQIDTDGRLEFWVNELR